MGVFAGVERNWASQTNTGRTHIATKGIVQSGLVLNLDAGVSSSYPTTGTTWTDLSGNGNNGTLVNGVGYSGDNFGSLVFDGVNDYVNCGNNSSTNFNGQGFTTCCWAYITIASGYDVFVARSGGGTGYISNLLWSGSVAQLRWWINNTVPVVYTSNKSYLNQWRYVCMSVQRPSNIGNIFEDGILVASSSVSSSSVSNTGNVLIGNDQFGSILAGNIAQVSIYNKALTAAEISQNFNATRGRYGI